jgi:hypothetical protein
MGRPVIRRRYVGPAGASDDTKAHDRHAGKRGDYVGDSPKQTRYRKRATNRRERREGQHEIRRQW